MKTDKSKTKTKVPVIWRSCCVCGKRLRIKLYPDRSYRGGEFFGRHKIPIEGTGEYKKIDTFKIGDLEGDVVEWTGKEKEFEYWECPDCYSEAVCEDWLEQKIEKLYGERCEEYEQDCIVCRVWNIYDTIFEDDKKGLEKKQRKYERKRRKSKNGKKKKDKS
ncbi:MAG: hypothetical protein JXB14_01185 [Candidatus Altiarchaeota archaeon]|nr:hypothetical protein [Candidatus Altiarchaeota archaeon]